MRIAYLINAPGPGISGAGQHTLSLAASDLARGDEPTIVAPEGSGMHEGARAIGAASIAAPMTALPWDIGALRARLDALDPHVVHAMSFVPLVLAGHSGTGGRAATFVSYLVDPASAHPMARSRFRWLAMRVRNAVARRYSGNVDAVFAVSQTIADRLGELGIRGNIVVARGGIDVADVHRRAAKPFSPPPGSPRIGWAAVDQVPAKGSGVLLEALSRIVEGHPKAICMLTGRKSPELDLDQLAAEKNIGERVHLLGLIDDPIPFIACLDLYVMPSLSEALNTSIMEALALGVPVVATDVGGTREVIEHEVTGLLVEAGDAGALAAAMQRLLDDTALAKRLADTGRARVEELFDRSKLYELTARHYREALTARGHEAGRR